MNKTVLLLALAFWLPSTAPHAAAQQTRNIEGFVRSATDTTALAGVLVRVFQTAHRTETDAAGRFILRNVPSGSFYLIFSRLGIAPDTVEVGPNLTRILMFLETQAVRMDPVLVEGAMPARERFETLAQTSTISISADEIRTIPAIMEPDVARVAQLLPGTVAKNDYSVGINVRGGETDQNLIRLDGITVFNPFHLGGLFSTFDASAVQNVDLITGGFPAPYGGRLSSVMDVQLRDGSRTGLDVHGAVSLLASRLLVDGPIGKNATFMIGGRRTYTDIITSVFSDKTFAYHFADGIAKLAFSLGRGSISATAYWGGDAFDLPWTGAQTETEVRNFAFSWGNRLAGLTWRQPIGNALFETHLNISEFRTRFQLGPDLLDATNHVRQLTARSSLTLKLAEQNELQIGFGVEDHRIRYDFSNSTTTIRVPSGLTVNGSRVPYDFGNMSLARQVLDVDNRPRISYAYLDDQWQPFSRLLLRPGIRVEYVSGGAGFTGISPRFQAKAFITDNVAVTASAGRYFQALHSIRDQEMPITLVDFWIGADEYTPVAQSDHLILGFEKWFANNLSLTVEGYSKTYKNLPLRSTADDPRIRGDEFDIATGTARGLEVLVRKHSGDVTGWIAYSLGKTIRTASGETFPPAHDRRHTLNIVLQFPSIAGGSTTLRWGYGSGLPYTGIVGQWVHRHYNADLNVFEAPSEEILGTTINGARFPHYSRLDMAFRWQIHKFGGTLWPYINIVNMYNRPNVFAYMYDFGAAPPTRSELSQLPILPTVGVEFRW